MNTLKIVAAVLTCLPLMVFAMNKNLSASEAKKVAAQSVLSQTAMILEISESQVVLDLPFSKQVSPADDLDFVEIIMAIESDLGISIDDSLLQSISGATDQRDIINFLSIRKLQDFVGTLPLPSSPEQPVPLPAKGQSDPLELGDSGAYGELVTRPNPEGYVIVTIPDINEFIPVIEQQWGRQLTSDEVKEAHAIAPSLVMSRDDAEEIKKLRTSRNTH